MFNNPAFLLIIVSLLAACATSPTGRSQLTLMPESKMTQMGLQAFENIKKETPVDTGAATNRYVNCVSQAIIREVGGGWEVVVFQNESANAFALPGRKIGVNNGLLKVDIAIAPVRPAEFVVFTVSQLVLQQTS